MQENEFEKKVRGLMDDLEISPSAPVWDYVEKRIPKSNRRRRFIAFFLLMAGFAVCGYFFYHKFSDDGTIHKTVVTSTVPKAATIRNSSDDHSPNNNGTITDSSTTAHTTTGDKKTVSDLKDKEQLLPAAIKSSAKSSAISSLRVKNEREKNFTITNTTIASQDKEPTITGDEPAIQPDANTAITNIAPAEGESSMDTIPHVVVHETDTTTATALQTNDTIQQIKPAKQKADKDGKKLQWGISGFYGRSDVVENISSITAEKSYSWDGSLNAGQGSSRNDSILYEDQSKNVKARSAFSVGIHIRKPLSSRGSITTGIAFMHMKTQIQTGISRDSTAVFYYNNSQSATYLQNFYRPGNASSQINTYSLLQVPVLYSYQLNQNKKLPFIIDAGLSFTRVLSSNALVYDSYNLAYYKNDALINKTQVHLLGGFNTSFIFRNKSNLIVGPQFQYGLTGIIKNNSSSQHFFAWGLQARYFIKK